jgi:predicted enzyme related to lactoylglutathione lyase
MDINGLVWAGVRTESFDETVGFFRDVVGLEIDEQQEGFVSFKLAGGEKFEVFGPQDRDHSFFVTGPVVGFGVDDVDAARSELESAGTEFLAPTKNEGGYKWAHFRGPDGNVYEVAGMGD